MTAAAAAEAAAAAVFSILATKRAISKDTDQTQRATTKWPLKPLRQNPECMVESSQDQHVLAGDTRWDQAKSSFEGLSYAYLDSPEAACTTALEHFLSWLSRTSR